MAANDVPCCEPMFWAYLVISAALVAFAGLMSGLTLGLMSLSVVDLEVLCKAGRPKDRKNAEKILPIVKNQHLLLCTLLICNSMAMEALPIFLDALLPAWGAILISVTLVLAFGEIIPQSVCSRYGLNIGAKLALLVRLLVIIVFPLAYPISKLLDLLIGKDHCALLRRAELKTFINMHGNEAGKGGDLTHHETTIISGALDLTQKTAKDAMTPLSAVFSLDLNSKLNDDTMNLILSKGHSRVPIYSGTPANIIGLVLVKSLIKCRPEDETPIRNLTIRTLPRVQECLPLYDLLNQFQKGRIHMALVVKSKNTPQNTAVSVAEQNYKLNVVGNSKSRAKERASGYNEAQRATFHGKIPSENLESFANSDEEIAGIITMEDVLEELIQEPILDETDDYIDVHNKIKINMLNSGKSSAVRSLEAASAIPVKWRTPMSSPLSSSHPTPVSSHHHSPVLCSPSPNSRYIQSPFTRPTLSASPGKSAPNSPAKFAPPFWCSPSSCQIPMQSYEKLKRRGDQ